MTISLNQILTAWTEAQKKPRKPCSNCGELRIYDTPFGPTECDECVETYWENQKSRDKPTKTLEERLAACGIPDRFRGCGFHNFDVVDKTRNAVAALHKILRMESGGAFIWGSPGTGKTHLLTAMAGEFLQRGSVPRFIYIGNLIQDITDSWRSDSPNPISRLSRYSVLLLDDLTFQSKPPDFVERELNLLLNTIYTDQSTRLFVSSNNPPDKLAEFLGDRFASRVSEICTSIPIQAEDHRLKKGKK